MINRWPEKYIIGLTGNIATGKSAVLEMAEKKGALTLDADQIVHEILDRDHFVQEAIVSIFGLRSQLPDGRVNREEVASIVFNDPEALSELEKMVHPAVRRRLYQLIDRSSNQIVLIEAIKLLEGGLSDLCSEVWVTRCLRETQIERLVTYRSMARDLVITRIDAQSPQTDKVAMADVVIDTDGSLHDTEVHFELAWLGMKRRMNREAMDAQNHMAPSDILNQEEVVLTPVEESDSFQGKETNEDNARFDLDPDLAFPGIIVRRAQLPDAARVAHLINKATKGVVKFEQTELFRELGERGYLIAQRGEEATAIAGWSAENLVATIDQIYIYPLEAAPVLGGALLHEIVRTANELICEVILAFPRGKDPDEIHHLLIRWGFSYVDPSSLPQNWLAAVTELCSDNSLVMIKILRDTRQTTIRYLNQVLALRSP